jgi:DNA-binding GntR family transcriptional regulator
MPSLDFSRVGDYPDVYKWEAVRDVIEQAILSGGVAPRERLPSEEYIAQSAGVSVKTVRHAIHALRERGLAVTRPGLGTFASRDIPG